MMRKKRIKKLKGLEEQRRKRKLYEYEDEDEEEYEYEDEDEEEYEDEEDSRLEELREYLDDVEENAKWLLKKVEKAVEVHKDKDWEIVELDRDEFAIWYGGFEGYRRGSVLTGEEVVECVKGIVDYIEYFVDTLWDDLNDDEKVEELYRIWKEYDVLGEVYGEIDIREGRIYIKSWAYSFGPYGRSYSGSVELRVIEEE